MITCYSGTPGSGKTYHAVHDIIRWLREGKNVITDFPVDVDGLRGLKGKLYLCHDLSVPMLIRYADCNHDYASENEQQTVLCIDESYNYFDPRDFSRPDRPLWVSFMKLHRHYCFDIVFMVQDTKTDLDKKVYRMIEYDVVHKKATRLNWGFQLLCLLTGTWFICIRWSCSKGQPRIKIDSRFVHLSKKFCKRYNSHHLFQNSTFGRQLADYIQKYGDGVHE